MFNVVWIKFSSCYKPVRKFWRAVIRFGSPRFSVESATDMERRQAANDDECPDAPCGCKAQLSAA